MLWQEANDDWRQERAQQRQQLMMQDETVDIEVALLQEREQQIRQLEVETVFNVLNIFSISYTTTTTTTTKRFI